MRRYLLAVLLGLLLASTMLLSVPAATQRPSKGPARQWSRTVFAPYYTVGRGYRAVLGLNNPTAKALIVSPVMYSLSGLAHPIPSLELAPGQGNKVDLADWIKTAGGEFATGSLQLTYQGEIPEFAAVLFLENEEKSLSVNNRLRGRGEFSSTQLEGIWWAPSDDALITVALSNTTDKKVTASIVMTRHDGSELKSLAVPLGPHQTRVFSNRDVVARETQLLGGVSITHDGRPGAVVAQSFVVDERTGFSLNLPFFDPTRSGDAKLEGTGILLGATTKEGEVPLRFSGRLLLRNVSPDAITATPALQQGAVRVELGEVWLGPGGSKEITVSPDVAVPGTPPTGIQITHTGAPGSLIGVWHSVDESESLVVEAPLSAPRPSVRTAGAHPFTLAGDTSAVLYIKNTGNLPAVFTAAIFYSGGDYMFGTRSVGAGETVAFDLRQIRDQQIPDFRGRVLPQDLTAAQVQWFGRKGSTIIGRVNVMSRSRAISNNMSCPSCPCGPTDAWLTFEPNGVVGAAGQTVSLHPVIHEDMCTNYTVDSDYYGWLDSTSDPSSVAVAFGAQVACYSPGTAQIISDGEWSVQDRGFTECEEGPCEPVCTDPYYIPVAASASVLVVGIAITDADIEGNAVNVTLTGPSGSSGTLVVTANASGGVSFSASANGGNPVGPGDYTVSFNRPSMPVAEYTSVTAKWNIASSGTQPSNTLNLSRTWYVMGTIRHSQYNTPYESSCSTTTQTAYLYDGSCNWQTVTLRSQFVSQTEINGTGVSTTYGVLKYDDGRCNANRPAGSTTGNSLLRVSSIAGQCNTTLTGGDSVATQPGPRDAITPHNCGDNMVLVNGSNANAFLKHVADRCANTATGCQDRHVDNYNSSAACNPRAFGDLPGSPYWTVNSR